MISNFKIFVICFLFLMTHISIGYFSDIKPTPILNPLLDFPYIIGDWEKTGQHEISSTSADLLGVDDYIDYTYIDAHKRQASLYVSYFSAIGVTGLYHSPLNCLPGSGWKVISTEKVVIRIPDSNNSQINKLRITDGHNDYTVYYWFQNRGRIVASEYLDKIYNVLDSLLLRRRDGSFIRIIGSLNDDEALRIFSEQVAIELFNFIPGR